SSAADALRICEDLRSIIHANVASDFQVGIQMLQTSVRGAVANMRTNLAGIKDPAARKHYEEVILSLERNSGTDGGIPYFAVQNREFTRPSPNFWRDAILRVWG